MQWRHSPPNSAALSVRVETRSRGCGMPGRRWRGMRRRPPRSMARSTAKEEEITTRRRTREEAPLVAVSLSHTSTARARCCKP
jgi:hypothetical protein